MKTCLFIISLSFQKIGGFAELIVKSKSLLTLKSVDSLRIFFDFINSVRIEYLSGFDRYQPFPEIIDFSVARNIDKANSYDLSQYQWSPLTNDVLISLSSEFPGNTFILCKMIDFIPDSFLNVETPLIGKLKFYKKYHKYFLITGRSAKDVEIKFFGSTI